MDNGTFNSPQWVWKSVIAPALESPHATWAAARDLQFPRLCILVLAEPRQRNAVVILPTAEAFK
jgi:hypothetical protein